MVRVLGNNLPDNKSIEYSLTLLYGIGFSLSKKILELAHVEPNKKTGQLTEEELKRILAIIDKSYAVEGDLKEQINGNIQRLKEIGSYRGMRHVRGLPVRGQRTRSNARTKRGKRKTVGALKKEAWAKIESGKTGAATAAPAASKSSK